MMPTASPAPTAPAPVEDTVTGYLTADQQRLDALLESCLAAARSREFEVALTLFRYFESAFLRHLQLEEQVVFPVFEDRTGLHWGPTVTLREEHRTLRRAVAALQEGVTLRNRRLVDEAARELERLTPDHDGKETNVFFPMTDRLLGPGERAALVERMRFCR